MSHFFQSEKGQAETSSYCPALFGNVPVSEFLTCVKRSCDTITVNQLDILDLFKRNLFAIKSEIDACINQLVGREMHLKKSSDETNSEKSSGNLQPATSYQSDRCKNIVIHGLNSLREVKNCELIHSVTEFVKTVLDVSINVQNVRLIKSSKRCVAVVELVSKKSKGAIFRNCHKLKNYHEKISITDDLSPEERKKRNQKSPKDVTQSHGVVDNNMDIPNSVFQSDLISCSQGQASPELKLEDTPHAYFWNSIPVVEKVQEMGSFGSKYEFTGLDFHEISRLVAVQNLERLENQPCICDSFMNIEWKRVKREFGHEIPKKVVKKFKESMNAIQAIWNEKHSSNFVECYCKHILTGINIEN